MKEKILIIIYKIGFWFIKISAAPGLLWFRPKCYYPGGKKIRIEGGALLIANHITMLDPYYMQYLVWYRNHHFVCLKEFYEKKARAFLFHCFQCIPVDRENAGTGTMREIAAHLKKEELVCMFPEGTVNRDGTEKPEIHQFKSGMVLVALMAGKPIVPMVMKKRKTIFSRLEAAIGEPVDVSSFYGRRPTVAEIDEITAYLQQKASELQKLLEEK